MTEQPAAFTKKQCQHDQNLRHRGSLDLPYKAMR